MTPSEILLKAADLLAERGWTQGQLVSAGGRVCALGAIRIACTGTIDVLPGLSLGDAGNSASRRLETYVGCWIASWNDAPERTAEDVILAMKRVAHDTQ
jgi:hypothetical protein